MKKIWCCLLISVCAGTLFSACGQESEQTEQTVQTEVNTESAAESKDQPAVMDSSESKDLQAPEDTAESKDLENAEVKEELPEEMAELKKCEGLFVQVSEETGDKYTANVSFYLKGDEVYASIDYSGYFGTIDDGLVTESDDQDYPFESSTTGSFSSNKQDFFIQFSETLLHIQWGDVCDYTLTRDGASADSGGDSDSDFENSRIYETLIKTIDNVFKTADHHVSYDPKEKVLSVYVEAPESTRLYLKDAYINNKTDILESWAGIEETTEKVGKQISVTLSAGDHGDVHIYWVDRLDSQDIYDEDDYLLHVVNDETLFNIMDEYSSLPKAEEDNTSYTEPETQENDDYSYVEPTSSPQTATSGERNALGMAQDYLSFMAFSYSGLIEQLKFEGFSDSEATYAADHCGADWNEQAVKKAEEYLDFMEFSREGLIEQLEYEGFSRSEAEYGVSQAY